jgi:hypothetical protein
VKASRVFTRTCTQGAPLNSTTRKVWTRDRDIDRARDFVPCYLRQDLRPAHPRWSGRNGATTVIHVASRDQIYAMQARIRPTCQLTCGALWGAMYFRERVVHRGGWDFPIELRSLSVQNFGMTALLSEIDWVTRAAVHICERDDLMKAADAAYLASALWRRPEMRLMDPEAAVESVFVDGLPLAEEQSKTCPEGDVNTILKTS